MKPYPFILSMCLAILVISILVVAAIYIIQPVRLSSMPSVGSEMMGAQDQAAQTTHPPAVQEQKKQPNQEQDQKQVQTGQEQQEQQQGQEKTPGQDKETQGNSARQNQETERADDQDTAPANIHEPEESDSRMEDR